MKELYKVLDLEVCLPPCLIFILYLFWSNIIYWSAYTVGFFLFKVLPDDVLQGVFAEYENKSYEKLVKSIEAHPSKAVQAVLKSFLAKIYKRQK